MPDTQGTPLASKADGLSVAKAAAQVGVHPQTIRNWIEKKQLPVTRFGAGSRPSIRIHPDDLRAMIQGPGDDR